MYFHFPDLTAIDVTPKSKYQGKMPTELHSSATLNTSSPKTQSRYFLDISGYISKTTNYTNVTEKVTAGLVESNGSLQPGL